MYRFLRLTALLCAVLTLVSCTSARVPSAESPVLARGQTVAQLHLEPVRHTRTAAVWIPYFTVFDLFSADSAENARSRVHALLVRLKADGINTVFVHAVPFGEAVYPSAYYPPAPEVHGADALLIFSEECMRLGISLHVWLNPLRLQTADRMDKQPAGTVLSGWYANEIQRGQNLSFWDGRYYLNPASSATPNFLSDAVREVTAAYHPAGVHIDDYFYPTDAPDFDERDFLESGAKNLADWRRSNITAIVKAMNAAAHESDADTLFSISPQGGIEENTEQLYADVPHWIAAGDCCDAIVPQIYFGYENAHYPFRETVDAWRSLPRSPDTRLMIGLAAYKVGNEDVYAGDGKDEWITNRNLLSDQAAELLADDQIDGIALYHADAFLSLPASERKLFAAADAS